MAQKLSRTPEGVVVRIIAPAGEEAWRQNHDDTWDHCSNHKEPWVRVNKIYVPGDVLIAVADFHRRVREEARNFIPCHGVAP